MGFNYEKFSSNNKNEILEKFKNEIEKWDNEFFKIYDRSTFKILIRRKRTIITEFGKIEYKRREYINKNTKERICFTDLNFGVKKNYKIPDFLRSQILNHLGKNETIKSIKSRYNISSGSVSKILSEKDLFIISENISKKKLS